MIAAHKRTRRRRSWQRSQMDCGQDGCGECRVCRRLEFLEWAGQVAGGVPHSIEQDEIVDKYIRRAYPHTA